jgi:putative ABC transport system substrate-binding protein
MKRREFIAGLGGAAFGSVAARAQPQRLRRVGILHGLLESDQEAQSRVAAFREQMQQLGWIEGANIRYETRVTLANVDNARRAASELVRLSPDAVLAGQARAMSRRCKARVARCRSCSWA